MLASTRTLEDHTSAATVLPAVRNLVTVTSRFAHEAKGMLGPRALTLASETHTYAGWLALDTNDNAGASRHFRSGMALAAEAGAGDHLAQALSFQGFRALIEQEYTESAALVQAAQRHSTLTSLSTFYALLAARALAIGGEHAESNAHLAQADRLLDRCDGSDLDSRTYWYTPAFLVAQRGLVHAYAGRRASAADDLAGGLAAMPAEQREAGWARLMRDTLDNVS
jgi:hypothetical protein